MLGAAETLADLIGRDRTFVDAAESRQFSTGVDLLQSYRDAGKLGDVVVVQLGTNGPVPPEEFDRLMGALSRVSKVLVVNLKVRWWEARSTSSCRRRQRYKNAVWSTGTTSPRTARAVLGRRLPPNPQGRRFTQVIAQHTLTRSSSP
jgi:hypothetical protein